MSCRVALLRMEADGLIQLPSPQKGNGNRSGKVHISRISDPQPELCVGAGALCPLRLELVVKGRTAQLWNELIQRYHYLGHKPLPGAQLRYLEASRYYPRPWQASKITARQTTQEIRLALSSRKRLQRTTLSLIRLVLLIAG